MTILIIIVAALVGALLALAILALVGSARGAHTPRHSTQRFSEDTERAIAQDLRLFGQVHPDTGASDGTR